jgi:hypothetical protein
MHAGAGAGGQNDHQASDHGHFKKEADLFAPGHGKIMKHDAEKKIDDEGDKKTGRKALQDPMAVSSKKLFHLNKVCVCGCEGAAW